MTDPSHPRHKWSQVTAAYDNPHYQPITAEKQAEQILGMHKDYLREAYAVDRENLSRLFGLTTAAYCLLYPLQRLWQLQMVRPDVRMIAPELNYRWTALKFVIQKEGANHLWRGVLPGCLYWTGQTSSAWLVTDAMRRPEIPHSPEDINQLPDALHGVLTTAAVAAAQFAIHPLRVVQVKMATDLRVKSLSTWYRYTTSLDCFARVYRYNGIKGLYRGASLSSGKLFAVWLYWWYLSSNIKSNDENGMTYTSWRFGTLLWRYRYEWLALKIHMAFYPIETIVTRRIYRVPTFRTDRLPKQFPKMFLPTFSGFLPMLRGFSAFTIHSAFFTLLGPWLQNAAEEQLLPINERPSSVHLLDTARFAVFQRHMDELKHNIAQYPHVDPYNTGSTARMREEADFSKLDRFQIPHRTYLQGFPGGGMMAGEPMVVDMQSLHRGTYDITAQSPVPVQAGSPVAGPSVSSSRPYSAI